MEKIFLAGGFFLGIFFLSVLTLFYFFRPFRLRAIAKKYSLQYFKTCKSYWKVYPKEKDGLAEFERTFLLPDSLVDTWVQRRNFIAGNRKNHTVLIYDLVDGRVSKAEWWRKLKLNGLYGNELEIARRSTEIIIDQKQIKCSGKIYGFCSVKKIDTILKSNLDMYR